MADADSRLILAVDGGGSSTQLSVFTADIPTTRPIHQLSVGATSHKAVGAAQACKAMQEGFVRLAGAGFPPDSFSIAVFGLSGMDTPEDEMPYRTMISRAALPLGKRLERTVVASDALLPLFAENESRGIALIAGTGSIALALDGNGRLHRVGGWGYGISDAGSGQWIGAQALNSVLRMYDHHGTECFGRTASADSTVGDDRIAPKLDQTLIRDVLDAAKCPDLDALAIWCSKMPSAAETAKLARAVINSDSPTATRIVYRAAESLTALCVGAARRFDGQERADLPIVLSGGLFNAEQLRKLTISMVKDNLGDNVRIYMSGHDPAYGAAVLGSKILKGEAEPPLFPTSMHREEGCRVARKRMRTL